MLPTRGSAEKKKGTEENNLETQNNDSWIMNLIFDYLLFYNQSPSALTVWLLKVTRI